MSNQRSTDIEQTARTIFRGFHAYHNRYVEISAHANSRFAAREWNRLRTDASERLGICRSELTGVVVELRSLLNSQKLKDQAFWHRVRAAYRAMLEEEEAWEIAMTFFNSITRRIFDTVGVNEQIEFVDTDFAQPPNHINDAPTAIVKGKGNIEATLQTLLDVAQIPGSYDTAQMEEDIELISDRIRTKLQEGGGLATLTQIQYLKALFFRGKRCYLITRLYSGAKTVPMVIAFRNLKQGVIAEALILEEADTSKLFSFARSYFHADVSRPFEVIQFLNQLMPRKRKAELYISLGYTKHGKTELYRDLLHQLRLTTEKWERARGTEGMVMAVFTMPTYDMVVKVIKDTFDDVKDVSRSEVREKYKMVYHHHRAGRLVDTQSFEDLTFPRDRFEPQLLEKLLRVAGETVYLSEDETQVHIRHAYIQRRVTPLDIYIREAAEEQIKEAVQDYGHAIKDLARCNIYPGDMMLKNFGVTRHGRVVFYDYDEINFVAAMHFREMPQSSSYGQAIAPEPWFRVDEHDVFPIEIKRFLGMPKRFREVFENQHADLYHPEFWERQQRKIKKGMPELSHPFREELRLRDGQSARENSRN
jgi:isocitrate dehydrogenase kinase/phosphatase